MAINGSERICAVDYSLRNNQVDNRYSGLNNNCMLNFYSLVAILDFALSKSRDLKT